MKHHSEEEQAPVVGFIDEEGRENRFYVLANIVWEGAEYAVMLPEPGSPAENGMYYIFEVIEELDSDTDTYRGVEDQTVIDAVYRIFCEEDAQ